ncbi:MAG: hypothetical protein DCC88_09290 [Spirobacillus cienkowskii]|jgi:hypothetical protein|uniref:DNA-binding domain-containing protein n=1 Tax=Spirobacillus cienkowskii TaxID=495820 RepID=A0A369KP26_9BACT|nr:MAG: hypothetical protein DCC88_09290 [Spirobacillus cienkowskii]
MNDLNLKNNQNFFLELVYSNPNISLEQFLVRQEIHAFNAKTVHRIQAYRNSFYARISNVFSETIFDLASCLFGSDFIKGFLIDYFYENPSPLEMTESVKKFPSFLEKQENISYCPFVPDFIKLCLAINNVLGAKNPDSDIEFHHSQINAENIYLQPEIQFLKSKWPIYQMYCCAKEIQEFLDEKKFNSLENTIEEYRLDKLNSISDRPENIFIYKSSPFNLECILVPKEFAPIGEQLTLGKNLLDAIEHTDIEETNFNYEKFSKWISLLSEKKAFIKKQL